VLPSQMKPHGGQKKTLRVSRPDRGIPRFSCYFQNTSAKSIVFAAIQLFSFEWVRAEGCVTIGM